MATYLITGTSRGIGLELTKQLLELPATQVGKVFAVTRSALSGPLQSLISSNPDRAIHIVAFVDDTASVQRAAREVKEKLGAQGLDVLVNNAGLLIPNRGGTKAVTPEHLARQFDVNVIGVQRVTSAFLPLLEAGNQKKVINVYVVILNNCHS
jgi:NAD(P)-dependent dehydrogenase (short-subunit alcohol dehydrogenase family)